MAHFISTEKTIEEYNSKQGIKDNFPSLYMYALYLCGGDFSSFDNVDMLEKAIMETEDKFNIYEV